MKFPKYLKEFTCSVILLILSGEILISGNSHKKKPDGLFPKDDSEMKKTLIPFV
jgi:hypothetical protein